MICLNNSLLTAPPPIDAVSMRRDALSVMTALRGYGGLHFSTAVEVLICLCLPAKSILQLQSLVISILI
jgi:hypothetical protein